MTEAYYIVLTLCIASLGSIYFCLQRKPKAQEILAKPPYRISDKDMDAILATAQYYKGLDEAKGYVAAWQYMKENSPKLKMKQNEKQRAKRGITNGKG